MARIYDKSLRWNGVFHQLDSVFCSSTPAVSDPQVQPCYNKVQTRSNHFGGHLNALAVSFASDLAPSRAYGLLSVFHFTGKIAKAISKPTRAIESNYNVLGRYISTSNIADMSRLIQSGMETKRFFGK